MIGSLVALQTLAASRSIPLTVHLELTYHCNARCTHCFQVRDAGPQEMSTEDWLRVVDEARAAGALILTLSGGEAMLSPHFLPVAERARKLGMAIRVFTNGILLTRSCVARLAAIRPMSVEVSIFSLRPEQHDAVTRVPGSLSRALRGLFRLRRAGLPIVVKCPIVAPSGAEHAGVLRLARRLEAGVIFDPQIFPRFDGSAGPTRCRGDDQSVVSYFVDAAAAGFDRPRSAPIPPDRPTCGMARTFAVVSPEGHLLPCPLLQTSAGNVREQPLGLLWSQSPVMQRLRARRFGSLPECGACPRSGYCGRCSAMALLEDGDLDGPSSRACRIAELRERAWGVPAPPGAPVPIRPRLRALQG